MTATEARAALPDILDRVLAGDEITITRHGRPVAVVVRPDSLTVRRATKAFEGAATIHELLARGRATSLDDSGALTNERAEELVADVRSGRTR